MKKTAFTTIACLALSGIMLNAATIKGKHTEEALTHTDSYQEIEEEAPQNDPLNAVVRIEAVSTVPSYALPWQNLMPQSCSGSGVVIEGNHILTNAHNIADSTLITVRKQNEDTLFVAKVKFVDHECDLALLSVDDPNFFTDITPMEFAETPPPQSMVIAAGFPMGGDGLSLTQGIISRIEVREYAHSDKDLLTAQIDASINPGNSGGPVLYEGRVVGIAFQGNKQGESLGYMIPYEIIRHFFDDIKDGKVDGFGNLGFLYMPLDNPDTRAFLKMKPGQTGILVRKVYKEFGSDVLQAGDVILSIDGKKVANNGNIRLADGQPRSFSTLISAKQVGESVNVELLRDGNVLNSDMLVQKTPDKIEPYLYDRHPEYFISGGLVFTRLTFSYLLAFGKNYPPFEIIEKYSEMKDSPDDNVVVLTQVLGDEVNVGYQNLDAMVLESINGQKVHNLREVTEMVENCKEEYITFEFEGDVPITLNTEKMRNATPNILERYRIPSDRYFESAVENQDSVVQSFEIPEKVTSIGNANRDLESEEDEYQLPFILIPDSHRDANAPIDIIESPRGRQDEEQSGRYGTIHSGQDGIHATKEMPAYYEQLNAFLRSKWSAIAPSSVELNGNISTWPVIELTIAKDGRVTKTVAISKSGNNVLDAAVEAMLLDLKDVPAPPQPAIIQVRFDIR